VLIESETTGGRVLCMVVGIGLNVNAEPGELVTGAVSLKEIIGRDENRDGLLHDLLEQLAKDVAPFYADRT
jgi:biotin-(acetyl-CoA carboxylase) ligase